MSCAQKVLYKPNRAGRLKCLSLVCPYLLKAKPWTESGELSGGGGNACASDGASSSCKVLAVGARRTSPDGARTLVTGEELTIVKLCIIFSFRKIHFQGYNLESQLPTLAAVNISLTRASECGMAGFLTNKITAILVVQRAGMLQECLARSASRPMV